MKKLFAFTISIYFIVIAFNRPSFSQTNTIGPPNGLEWGMSYSEAKTTLMSKNIEIEKPKYEKEMKLPKGFKVAKVGKYEILDRKTDNNKAIFNTDGGLCSFQIIFRFPGPNARKEFFDTELKKAISGKYSGEGFKGHNEPDKDGIVPELAFKDEVGNEISIYFQTVGAMLGPYYDIIVSYSNEEILTEIKKQQKTIDKF